LFKRGNLPPAKESVTFYTILDFFKCLLLRRQQSPEGLQQTALRQEKLKEKQEEKP